MADIKNVFDIAARSMSAQMVRLNTVASNLANARSVASSEADAYRAIKPVFKTIMQMICRKVGYLQSMSWISWQLIGCRINLINLDTLKRTKMVIFILPLWMQRKKWSRC